MFRFVSTELLFGLLLVPALAAFFWGARQARKRALAQFGDLALVQKLSATLSRRARAAKSVLILLAVAFLILALARPQFGTRVETVRSEGQDVIVALDVSRSMLAEDVAPNRLERARLEIMRILQRLDGDRIGLVAFAGNAFVQSPLTVDYGAAALFLNAMDPGLIPIQGTNLGEALTVALDAFEEGTRDHRVLIVVTDGEDHEGQIDEVREKGPQIEPGMRATAVLEAVEEQVFSLASYALHPERAVNRNRLVGLEGFNVLANAREEFPHSLCRLPSRTLQCSSDASQAIFAFIRNLPRFLYRIIVTGNRSIIP
ncbi:MAG: VWA domain-containing protein [Gemmatimonadetes bacterium]|nr:VWA domain-containing protein [Gemmatimonadota bacterium]